MILAGPGGRDKRFWQDSRPWLAARPARSEHGTGNSGVVLSDGYRGRSGMLAGGERVYEVRGGRRFLIEKARSRRKERR